MSTNPQAIVQFLRSGGTIETRLRELSDGDVHDLPGAMPSIPELGLEEEDLIRLLERLEEDGILVRKERVHPHDTSEYRVSWLLAKS